MEQGVLFKVKNEGEVLDVYGITNYDGTNFFVVYDEKNSRFDVLDVTEYSRL